MKRQTVLIAASGIARSDDLWRSLPHGYLAILRSLHLGASLSPPRFDDDKRALFLRYYLELRFQLAEKN